MSERNGLSYRFAGMRLRVLCAVIFASTLIGSVAQAADKTSANSGSWATAGTWSPSGQPGANDNVTIENGHSVTVAVAVVNFPSNVTINAGGTLTLNHTLTVNGTTTVNGSLFISNTSGNKIFTGDVVINDGGLWQETVAEDVYYWGNLRNDGIITASSGIHYFIGAGKTIGGTKAITNASVTVSGTYTNNGMLTVGTALTGTNSLTQGVGSTLKIGQAAVPAIGTLNASDNPNTVNYYGGAQTVKPIPYHHLTLSGSGAKNLLGVTTVAGVLDYGSSGTTVLSNNISGGALTMTSGTLNLGAGLTHTFTGAWTRIGGTLNGGSSTLKIGGSVSGSGGAFTGGTGTVEWNAAGDQTLAAVDYNNLILSGSGAKSISAGTAAAGNLSIATGAKASLADGMNMRVTTLTLGGVDQARGTWGSSTSGATHTNDTFFAATTGLITVNADSSTLIWRGTGDWHANPENWVNGIPGTGSNVWIASGTVTLSSATSPLGEVILGAQGAASGATLVFTNWDTTVVASNVTVLGNGIMTLPPPFTSSQMSNRVHIVCTNFTLEAGGTINADARGFVRRNGPGKGSEVNIASSYGGGGGGYGGRGGGGKKNSNNGEAGVTPGGPTYGSTNAPLDPGSGGGANAQWASSPGHGGGAVRIAAAGTVMIEGTVTANGSDTTGNTGGGGSGGAIFITCNRFGGSSNGLLQADGGGGAIYSGGGGGGRIAVHYASLDGNPGVRFSANSSSASRFTVDVNSMEWSAPAIGTLCFTNSALMDTVLATAGGVGSGLNGYVYFESTNVWSPKLLVMTNSTLGIPEGYAWQITNDLTVTTGTVVVAEHATLACDRSLTLTNGARLIVYGGATNEVYADYGALVSVTNTLTVGPACWIYPISDGINGGSVLLRTGNLTLMTGGGIDANGRGYGRTYGTGKGTTTANSSSVNTPGGGGYGGKGGNGAYAGGSPYGSTNTPIAPGSGGGSWTYNNINFGGHGGGSVRVESAGSVKIDGMVTANGENGLKSGAGGSGGAIFITCASLSGAETGALQAEGGDSGTATTLAGGGGGGRIAVWVGVPADEQQKYLQGLSSRVIRSTDLPRYYLGSVPSVVEGAGHTGTPAEPGTAFFFVMPALQGTVFMMR